MTEIQCFWHGSTIDLLEKLTLNSFIKHGYSVKLWCYEDVGSVKGLTICDANEIIPYEKIFYYRGNGDCRKNSLGGFSDLFRYELIYKKGGVYVDMDSVCLSYYNFDSEYVIKPHLSCGTVANILKAPTGCEFLEKCIFETKKYVNENNNEWVLPVNIFNQNVNYFKLNDFIVPENHFGCDDNGKLRLLKTQDYLKVSGLLPKYVLHWCREASYGNWTQFDYYNWKKPRALSVYSTLLSLYNVVE